MFVILFRKADSFTNFHQETKVKEDTVNENKLDMDDLVQNDSELAAYLNEHHFDINQIDRSKFNRIREKYSKEKRASSLIRELITYSIFLIVLLVVCYTNKDLQSFNYQNQLKKLFGVNEKRNNSLEDIVEVSDFWKWSRNVFLNGIKSYNWYNSIQTSLNNYLNDHTSFIIGYPIIRQLRVKNGRIFINQ